MAAMGFAQRIRHLSRSARGASLWTHLGGSCGALLGGFGGLHVQWHLPALAACAAGAALGAAGAAAAGGAVVGAVIGSVGGPAGLAAGARVGAAAGEAVGRAAATRCEDAK
jgi:hypothetical protein